MPIGLEEGVRKGGGGGEGVRGEKQRNRIWLILFINTFCVKLERAGNSVAWCMKTRNHLSRWRKNLAVNGQRSHTHTHTHPDRDSIQRYQLAEFVGIWNVKDRDPNLTVNNLLARWDHIIPVPFPPDGARV